MSKTNFYLHQKPFELECGTTLRELQIAYHTQGKLNKNADNVIWVCHAYTANSDVESWWTDTVGSGLLFDTDKYFIVCANVIGSCYGSTGPLDLNPETGRPWYRDFPLITVRDVANAHEILRKHLKITSVYMAIGGSIGAFQALEWSIMFPEIIRNLVFIAASAFASPWNIAFNEAQRMAIHADSSFFEDNPKGGLQGLKAARAMALISYRTSEAYNLTQKDESNQLLSGYKAVSYQQYQGEKLIQRYNAFSYVAMSRLFDSHNVGRGRESIEAALKSVKAKTLVLSLDTDRLFPTDEQKFVADHIPGAVYKTIYTDFGHDGFLIEVDQLTKLTQSFLSTYGKA
ncbi:MAG: homoserine O-acetyltransferase [Bacteroidales bacterium]|nr:homoserine O-acetyltransferase [Bacteroidales bacterium]